MRSVREKLNAISVTFSLTFGLFIFSHIQNIELPNFLSHTQNTELHKILKGLISILSSVTLYEILFNIFCFFVNRTAFLLKFFLGKVYLEGFWSYTYYVDRVKKYGGWIIDQNIDTIEVQGFGLLEDGVKRSNVQSVSSLIKRGYDYEIVNSRRDIDKEGSLPDISVYSKTSLHFETRKTFLRLFEYPLEMSGTTIVYGGDLSGKTHNSLKFVKHSKIKTEAELIKNIVEQIKNDKEEKDGLYAG